MQTKQEFSAGGVVYKKTDTKVVFLLGKHSGYHKWVLPKGLIEEGEEAIQTAVRETEEEIGVVARVVDEKPLHVEEYGYWAEMKEENTEYRIQNSEEKENQDTRRIAKYQEEGRGKVRVYKTVTFYLMEYVSGDPSQHGWEMEEAGWFSYEEALKKMSFEGEKKALEKAVRLLELTN